MSFIGPWSHRGKNGISSFLGRSSLTCKLKNLGKPKIFSSSSLLPASTAVCNIFSRQLQPHWSFSERKVLNLSEFLKLRKVCSFICVYILCFTDRCYYFLFQLLLMNTKIPDCCTLKDCVAFIRAFSLFLCCSSYLFQPPRQPAAQNMVELYLDRQWHFMLVFVDIRKIGQ